MKISIRNLTFLSEFHLTDFQDFYMFIIPDDFDYPYVNVSYFSFFDLCLLNPQDPDITDYEVIE